MELSQNEMFKVKGGVAWDAAMVVGAIIIYIIGVVSGYTNPTKCNN